MEFTVQNNNLLYSVSFTEEIAWIGVRDLSNGLYESVTTLRITEWHIIEHQRQQLDTYHQQKAAITENQLGTHAMGHEVAVVSGQHYPHVNVIGSDFPANYGQIPNSWFTTPDVCQVSSLELENNLSK